jgi:hypothetical protein
MTSPYSKRRVAATALRDFLDGKMTNEDFIETFPRDGRDPVLVAVADLAWFCYSDLHTHRLKGKYELQGEMRQLLERAYLFLQTELAYEWPGFRFMNPQFLFLRLLGLRRLVHNRFERFKATGDWEVWPFRSRRDYERYANASASQPVAR